MLDHNGNQTSKTKAGDTHSYTYDIRDQLIQVNQNAVRLGRYQYSYDGLRTQKEDTAGVLRYTYDDQSVLLQTDTSGSTVARYSYGNQRLIALDHTTDGTQYYLHDGLGSVANTLTTTGSVQVSYQYDAFGNPRNTIGSSENIFGFTGHEKDDETGLIYAKARFYDPDTGRFLSEDAFEGYNDVPPSLHKYLYAYANPTVWVDLTGHASVLLPHELASMEDAADSSWGSPADVSYEASKFVKAAGGRADRLGGEWAVREKSAREISSKVRSVVGDQDGATALIIEEGDTLEIVARDVDAQLGPRWQRSGVGKSLLARRLRGAKEGDIVDISSLYRAAYNDTLAANESELQGFARDQRSTAAATNFSETPSEHINAVSAGVAADMQRTLSIANDDDAPPFMRHDARQAWAEGVAFTAMPLGVASRGKALGTGASTLRRTDARVLFDAAKQAPRTFNQFQTAVSGNGLSAARRGELWEKYKSLGGQRYGNVMRPVLERAYGVSGDILSGTGEATAIYSISTFSLGFQVGFNVTPLQPDIGSGHPLLAPYELGEILGGFTSNIVHEVSK